MNASINSSPIRTANITSMPGVVQWQNRSFQSFFNRGVLRPWGGGVKIHREHHGRVLPAGFKFATSQRLQGCRDIGLIWNEVEPCMSTHLLFSSRAGRAPCPPIFL